MIRSEDGLHVIGHFEEGITHVSIVMSNLEQGPYWKFVEELVDVLKTLSPGLALKENAPELLVNAVYVAWEARHSARKWYTPALEPNESQVVT